ncbi:type I restriction enzyme, S subunit [Priestia aryabhattai B8W22]|uniref:restriction endonuclease subunit S n=1 Tax=Priestia aryabhattai TaxID=412384 RepID=UPI00087EF27B|nr:type I restriction enzyme, S subunit [Priestia aryabhattai B8W22]
MNVPKLRFKEFDGEWEAVQLGNLLSFNNGINADKDSYGHGRKFINVLDILNNNSIQYDNIIGSVSVSEKTEGSNKVEYGDILFLRSSETREDVGKSSVYLDQKNFALFGGFVIRGKKQADYAPYFLKLNLESPKVRHQIGSKAGGSTRYNVSQSILNAIEVNMPPLDEQEKIEKSFVMLDKKIQLQQEKIDLLKEQKKGLMHKIFKQQIRFKDDDGKDYSQWHEVCISNIITPNLREIPKPNKPYIRLGLRSHAKGTFHELVTNPETVNMDKLFVVHENDFIINITFAWEQALAIANKNDHGKLVSHRFPTYTFNEEHYSGFYKYYFTTKSFKYYLGNASPGGAGRNRVLNKKDFMNIKLSIPSLNEQKKIAKFLSKLDEKIQLAQQKLRALQEQKKGYMQMMFI